MSSNSPYPSPLFVFYNVKNILLEKFSEIVSRHTNVNIIVYLNGNADAVALSNTEATGKHYLIVDVMFFNGFLEKLYNILRALEMTGGADANLNEQHSLIPSKELLC